MNLTDAGHLLYRYAIANRAELDGLRSQAEEFDALRRGQVRIATVEGMLTSFLPDFFIGLSRDYPGISMSVTAVGSGDVAEMVSQNGYWIDGTVGSQLRSVSHREHNELFFDQKYGRRSCCRKASFSRSICGNGGCGNAEASLW
jgi:DNA-binding transcriptional LysR family regulator